MTTDNDSSGARWTEADDAAARFYNPFRAEIDGDEVILRMPRQAANRLLRELIDIDVLDGDARGCVELDEIKDALTDVLLPVEE